MDLDRRTVDEWLARYVAAWRANQADPIRALFTNYATYRFKPWEAPISGADAIVASWLENPDPPDSWEASYQCQLVEGTDAIAVGTTSYVNGSTFANLFQLRFESGRCSEFIDWYMTKENANDVADLAPV